MPPKAFTLTKVVLLVGTFLLTTCQSAAPPSAATPQQSTPTSITISAIAISTGEWAPFSGEQVYQNGFVLHVIREAYAREGLQVQYDFFPWERAYQSALREDSPYTATAYWYRSPERESDCLYSEPLIEEEMVLFFRKADPLEHWETLTDLEDYRIGISLGVTYPEDFKELAESGELNVQEAPDDELNFRKLLAGRIDIFPTTSVAGLELLRNTFTPAEMAELDYNKKPIMVSTGHLLFCQTNPTAAEQLNIFNSGLQKLMADGTYAQLYADLLAGRYSEGTPD